MKSRKLGKSGFAVSEVGLGCWQLGGDFGPVSEARSQRILDAAARSGINFWDTADVYGGGRSEQLIRKYRDENGPEVFVATKVGRDAELYPDGYTKTKVKDADLAVAGCGAPCTVIDPPGSVAGSFIIDGNPLPHNQPWYDRWLEQGKKNQFETY